jgi:DNA repair exonuclease SbcCD nuclease subunit
MTRFLHSADWQLGMTRHFLDADAQARFSQARIDAVRTLAMIARETACAFAVVAGDVFEHSQLERRTIARALAALRDFTVPVFLLPGNHDPLDAASIYRSDIFLTEKPANVHVLETSDVVEVTPGVEVVGAPWSSKRPLADLVAGVIDRLDPAPGRLRVMVAHGAVDVLSPNADDPARIVLSRAEQALADGRIHYLALGDRHSTTRVGDTGRVFYAGAPEPTAFSEVDAGHALVVEIDREHCDVTARRVGTWWFYDRSYAMNGDADIDAVADELEQLPDRERTVLRLALRGTVTLKQKARLDDLIERHRPVYAALEQWDRHTDLAVHADETDFADLDVSGFVRDAVTELRGAATSDGAGAATARDALSLLLRLAGTRA